MEIIEDNEIQQDFVINKFVRENPGPYFNNIQIQNQNIDMQRLSNINNQINQANDKNMQKINELNVKIHSLFTQNNERDEQTSSLKPISNLIDKYNNDIYEIEIEVNKIAEKVKAEEKRKELEDIRGDVKVNKNDELEKSKQEILNQYDKLDNEINKLSTLFDMMNSHFKSDLTDLQISVKNIQNKIEENVNIIENAKSFVDKAQIHQNGIITFSGSFQDKIDEMKLQKTDLASMNEYQQLNDDISKINEEQTQLLENSKNSVSNLEKIIFQSKLQPK